MKAIIAASYIAGIAGVTVASYIEHGIGSAFATFGIAMLFTTVAAALKEYA